MTYDVAVWIDAAHVDLRRELDGRWNRGVPRPALEQQRVEAALEGRLKSVIKNKVRRTPEEPMMAAFQFVRKMSSGSTRPALTLMSPWPFSNFSSSSSSRKLRGTMTSDIFNSSFERGRHEPTTQVDDDDGLEVLRVSLLFSSFTGTTQGLTGVRIRGTSFLLKKKKWLVRGGRDRKLSSRRELLLSKQEEPPWTWKSFGCGWS